MVAENCASLKSRRCCHFDAKLYFNFSFFCLNKLPNISIILFLFLFSKFLFCRQLSAHTKKSDCHIHATLKQRLDAVYKLRNEHSIKTLCRVLRVNRSTYYKHFFSPAAPRVLENQDIRGKILNLYARSDKRLGALLQL